MTFQDGRSREFRAERRREFPPASPCQKCGGDRYVVKSGHFLGKQRFKPHCIICERTRQRKYKRAWEPSFGHLAVEWQSANKEKRAAHLAVKRALNSGDLVRKDCERCGSPKTDAHHEDYSLPLVVNWLCRLHHKERHREMVAATK